MRRLLLLLGLAVVSGCGDDAGIEGVPWALESGASATFADGTVTGSTGCNRFTASYALDGEKLEIGHVAATQMACPPPADKIERDYLAALDRVAAWDRTGDELSSTLLGTEVTAEFGKDGKLTGSAGCNTEMACTGPQGVMEQEQAYLSALPRAVKYTVEGSRLSLLTAHDTFVATYERAP